MRKITPGATDQSVVIRIVDSTDGTPEQAVEHDTAGVSLWYRREGATITAITPAALAALNSAHSDGGLEHIDDGYYRLDLPDAAVAAGVAGVMVGGAFTGMVVIGCYVEIETPQTGDAYALTNSRLPAALVSGRMSSDAVAISGSTAAADAVEANIDNLDDSIAGVVTDIAALQADTDNIQTRIPAALVGGRIDASAGAVGTGAITSASFATGAITFDALAANSITANALAADAVAEIQSSFATEATLVTVQANTEDIQARLPAALSGGLMMATVETMSAAAVDSIHDEVVDGTLTMRESLRLANSANAGKVSGAGTVTVRIRDVADTKDRVVATVDADGNRTTVTRDVT